MPIHLWKVDLEEGNNVAVKAYEVAVSHARRLFKAEKALDRTYGVLAYEVILSEVLLSMYMSGLDVYHYEISTLIYVAMAAVGWSDLVLERI